MKRGIHLWTSHVPRMYVSCHTHTVGSGMIKCQWLIRDSHVCSHSWLVCLFTHDVRVFSFVIQSIEGWSSAGDSFVTHMCVLIRNVCVFSLMTHVSSHSWHSRWQEGCRSSRECPRVFLHSGRTCLFIRDTRVYSFATHVSIHSWRTCLFIRNAHFLCTFCLFIRNAQFFFIRDPLRAKESVHNVSYMNKSAHFVWHVWFLFHSCDMPHS